MAEVVREDPTKATPETDPIRAAIETSVAELHDVADEDAGEVEPVEPVVEPVMAVDTTTEHVVEPVVAEKAVADKPAAAAAVDPKQAASDALAKDLGLKAKDKHGRENKIPHSDVVGRLIPVAVKKAEAAWKDTHVKPLEEKLATYETRLQSIGSTEALMFGTLEQKRQFLDQLASSVPGYRELLGEAKTAPVTAKPSAAAVATDDPEPKPDAKDEKGAVIGWTEEGLAKLRAWDRRQAATEGAKAAEDVLVKKYGLDKVANRFSAVERSEADSQAMDTQLTQAQSWPGFVDNAQAILDVLAADKPAPTGRRYANGQPEMKCKHTLESAYRHVLWGKASVDPAALETTLTEKIRKELERAPRSTSAAGATGAHAAERVAADEAGLENMDPTERAIRQSIKNLPRT